jgi:iron complex outermembrane receptor protein
MVFLLSIVSAGYGEEGNGGGKEGDTGEILTDLSLEQLMEIQVATVYGASKYEQKVTEAPSSISIVTADEIRKYGYRTLADILRGQRSFYATYDRNYSYAGVRGFGRPGDFNTRVFF